MSLNFTLREMQFSSTAERLGINNLLPFALMPNAELAAQGMEEVRELLGGHPIHVDSWYRCAELNHAVGSKGTSAHPLGFAVDFICPVAGTPVRLVQLIQASRISFDQVIQEGSWVHISFAPARRRQVLTARFNPGGETTYTIGVSNA